MKQTHVHVTYRTEQNMIFISTNVSIYIYTAHHWKPNIYTQDAQMILYEIWEKNEKVAM